MLGSCSVASDKVRSTKSMKKGTSMKPFTSSWLISSWIASKHLHGEATSGTQMQSCSYRNKKKWTDPISSAACWSDSYQEMQEEQTPSTPRKVYCLQQTCNCTLQGACARETVHLKASILDLWQARKEMHGQSHHGVSSRHDYGWQQETCWLESCHLAPFWRNDCWFGADNGACIVTCTSMLFLLQIVRHSMRNW